MVFEGFESLDGADRAMMVILVSEIGDKTFLIAAILAMRHPRSTIFAGSISALAVMSLLSSVMGTLMPAVLPKRYTTAAAALLFFFFGARMLQEGLEMEAGEKGRERMDEEIREVQKEVEQAEDDVVGRSSAKGSSYPLTDLEEGRMSPRAGSPAPGSPSTRRASTTSPVLRTHSKKSSLVAGTKDAAINGIKEGGKNLAHLFFSPIFVQAFIMTFLAEWGDRSQIATIALAAAHNVWLITAATTFGHSICTAIAVISGRWVSQHISIKHVTLGGAILFLIFGLVYSYEAWTYVEDVVDAVAT